MTTLRRRGRSPLATIIEYFLTAPVAELTPAMTAVMTIVQRRTAEATDNPNPTRARRRPAVRPPVAPGPVAVPAAADQPATSTPTPVAVADRVVSSVTRRRGPARVRPAAAAVAHPRRRRGGPAGAVAVADAVAAPTPTTSLEALDQSVPDDYFDEE